MIVFLVGLDWERKTHLQCVAFFVEVGSGEWLIEHQSVINRLLTAEKYLEMIIAVGTKRSTFVGDAHLTLGNENRP